MKRAKVFIGLVLLAVLAWVLFGGKKAEATTPAANRTPPANANWGTVGGVWGWWDYDGTFVPYKPQGTAAS